MGCILGRERKEEGGRGKWTSAGYPFSYYCAGHDHKIENLPNLQNLSHELPVIASLMNSPSAPKTRDVSPLGNAGYQVGSLFTFRLWKFPRFG
jgi:hypothetical protein